MGWVCLMWVGMSGGWYFMEVGLACLRGQVNTHPPDMEPGGWVSPRGWVPPRHGISWDTVDKRSVRLLLECFLIIQYI